MEKIMDLLVQEPLFEGIQALDLQVMLNCIGYYVKKYNKNETIALEEEHISYVGIVLKGAVDMIKEDLWGNKTLIARMHEKELFGETFACGEDTLSVVTFAVPKETTILFLPFDKVMHTCSRTCKFHQQLIENMVRLIANKSRDLMRKVEVISKKSLREKIMTYLSIQAQANGTKYFELPLGRIELADYLCADRSALTRELANMKAEGLIDYDKNMFRIL